jgi:hypothetical protein
MTTFPVQDNTCPLEYRFVGILEPKLDVRVRLNLTVIEKLCSRAPPIYVYDMVITGNFHRYIPFPILHPSHLAQNIH